ncbi:MAG: hypothetical protein ACRCXT_20575 [Paraclostridium sp.]
MDYLVLCSNLFKLNICNNCWLVICQTKNNECTGNICRVNECDTLNTYKDVNKLFL